MIRVKKLNQVYTVSEDKLQEYLRAGFSVIKAKTDADNQTELKGGDARRTKRDKVKA